MTASSLDYTFGKILFKWVKWIFRFSMLLIWIYHIQKNRAGYLLDGIMLLSASILIDVFFSVLKIHLPLKMDITLHLFIFLTLGLGTYFNFYGSYYWWDLAVHGLSGIFLGLLAPILLFLFVGEKTYKGMPPFFILFFIIIFGVATAGLWEIWEFTGDHLFGMNSQLGSLQDTMWDIVTGSIGGLFSALYFYLYYTFDMFGCFGTYVDEFIKLNPKR